jgi:ATP-binding cassette subfamily B protein
MGPKVLAQATNKLFEGIMGKMADAGTKIDFVFIGRIIVQLIMLYLSSAVFSYIQGFIMSGISMKISYRLRREISGKIGACPCGILITRPMSTYSHAQPTMSARSSTL